MTFTQFFQVLRARRKAALITFMVIVIATLLISLLLPKQYTAEASLVIDVKANDPVTGMQVAGQLEPSYVATQVDIISSHNVALNVVQMLGLDRSLEIQQQFLEAQNGKGVLQDWLADGLLKKLDVKPSRESSVIDLEYTSSDPKFSSAVANAFCRAFIKTVVDIRLSSAQQNNAFFEDQLKSLKRALLDAQRGLLAYQELTGIVASDERVDVETQRLSEIATQLVVAQSQTYDAQSRAHGGDAIPDVLNNPLIQQLKIQLADQEAKFKEAASKEGVNNPHYQEARESLEATRQRLAAEEMKSGQGLSNGASNSASRTASLLRVLAQQKAKVLEIKAQRAKLDVMQRDVDDAQKAYDSVRQRYTETSLESHSEVANVGILKAAPEPTEPSKPRIMLNLVIATLMGCLLGIGVAMMSELVDRRVRSISDIEEVLDIPVLADLTSSARKRYKRLAAASSRRIARVTMS